MREILKGNIPNLTQRNLLVIGGCLVLVLVALLFGPVLQEKRKNNLDMNIAESVENSQILTRAVELRQLVQERAKRLHTTTAPSPVEVKALPSDQVDTVLDEVRRLAGESGVKLVSFRPMLETMGQDSKSMQIGATCYGSMEAFQDMLALLVQVPYVERLQGLLLSGDSDGLQLEIDFSVKVL